MINGHTCIPTFKAHTRYTLYYSLLLMFLVGIFLNVIRNADLLGNMSFLITLILAILNILYIMPWYT